MDVEVEEVGMVKMGMEKERKSISGLGSHVMENDVSSTDSFLSCSLQGNTVELPEEENTPEKRVDRIFAMMDKVCSFSNF